MCDIFYIIIGKILKSMILSFSLGSYVYENSMKELYKKNVRIYADFIFAIILEKSLLCSSLGRGVNSIVCSSGGSLYAAEKAVGYITYNGT